MNAIKKKREIVWINWLPHQGGRPHLPEVPHFHVNRPLETLGLHPSVGREKVFTQLKFISAINVLSSFDTACVVLFREFCAV